MNTVDLLRRLTVPYGVSGAESPAVEAVCELLEGMTDNVFTTGRGSVIGEVHGRGPRIMLDAHVDQVGFVVTYTDENGFVRFDKCGGTDERILSGLEVTILGAEPVYGVVSSIPPHLANPEDEGKAKSAKDLAVDTGLSSKELSQKVHPGDRIVPRYSFCEIAGNKVMSGALDDRSGIAVIIKALSLINGAVADGEEKPELVLSFSVGEEVSGRGAANSAFLTDADMAIAVDVSFARTPGCAPEESAEMGKGPMIGISPIISREISDRLIYIAKEKDIPYQTEIMSGRTGTHADEIAVTKAGIKTGLVSFPLKFMHTPVEVVDTEDINNSARLIAAFCLECAREGRAN